MAPKKKEKHGNHHCRHSHKRRRKQPRGAIAAAAAQERKLARAPHSFVFARPGCGSMVKALSVDFRRVFEPFTASQLRATRRNVLKDFITIAGPLHVSHILYFTHPRLEKLAAKRTRHAANLERRKKSKMITYEGDDEQNDKQDQALGGGVYLHVIRTPNGPSLTFRVMDYCLTKDVFNLVRKVFDVRQYSSPPLLAMTGFGSSECGPPPPHLRLLVDMFQNMLPSLNIQKLKVSSVRRVLLLSREVDACGEEKGESKDVIFVRHYNIRLENRSISRALRRLGMGGAPLRRKRTRDSQPSGLGPQGFGKSSGVPSLANYASIEDYLTKANLLTESAASELEDMAEVDLPGQSSAVPAVFTDNAEKPKNPSTSGQVKAKDLKEAHARAKAAHGYTHLSGCRKASVRLTEIGPRLTLQLIKIEEGVNTGTVLYHSWHKRTPEEIAQQEVEIKAKEALKAQRRAEHERRRQLNEEATAATHTHTDPLSTPMEAEEDTKSDDFGDVVDRDDKLLMHQLSDTDEAVEPEAEIVKEPISIAKRKKKKIKKIPKKHPAFNYLTQKAEDMKLARKMKR